MLSAAARPYIDASVPVLREHGVAITTVFYRNMFKAHPELTNLFNMGNQAQGTQPKSLAAAVFAYAANIDNPAALAPVISRIAHKHASLGITAAQYPIVGENLLGAIKEVLGDAATQPLLDAWAEAYGLLADVLIAEEKKLYTQAGTESGEMRNFAVSAIREQGELVRAFEFVPADGGPLPDFHPGQYVSVTVNFADGTRQLRQYSLSDAPNKPYLRISVKRELEGKDTPSGRVSNWLHDNVKVGDQLLLSAPFGEFQPNTTDDMPIVLMSAGVGITPMISVINTLAEKPPGHKVMFAHAARAKSHHAHLDDLENAQKRMPNLKSIKFYEAMHAADCRHEQTLQGQMQVSSLPEWPLADSNIYLCGPLAFMQKQRQQLLAVGVPSARIHREVFGPDMLDHLM